MIAVMVLWSAVAKGYAGGSELLVLPDCVCDLFVEVESCSQTLRPPSSTVRVWLLLRMASGSFPCFFTITESPLRLNWTSSESSQPRRCNNATLMSCCYSVLIPSVCLYVKTFRCASTSERKAIESRCAACAALVCSVRPVFFFCSCCVCEAQYVVSSANAPAPARHRQILNI